jgi:fructan beta-fructosidase
MYKVLACAIVMLFLSCKESKTNTFDKLSSTEPYRPQYHFTPDSMWMNDPNGMVYHDGEYHLFYQYHPKSTVWGPMHWGHAVSKDMVHWQHLPIALYPDSLGLIFSGSAVIDHNNTSGFGKDGKPPMVAIFTHHLMSGEKAGKLDFQNQSIAYSLDNGRTFTKYEGNPVVKNPGIKDFRDPKVIWHEATKKWIMVFAAYDKALFYTSPDLKSWTKTGSFGIKGDDRLWECPDLFPMKVESSDETKWVLMVSIQKKAPNGGTGTSYFVGDFDGKTFVGDTIKQQWLDYGKDNYAMLTWSNVTDGRTLALGWMSNWQYAQQVPTHRWRSAMTLPRSLTLHKLNDKYLLRSMPVEELAIIEEANTIVLSPDLTKPQVIPTTAKLTLQSPKEDLTLRLSNSKGDFLDIGYDTNTKTYFIDRTHAGASDFSPDFAGRHIGQTAYDHDSIKMTVYLDHASVELFADDGQCVMTEIFFPKEPMNKLEVVKGKVMKLTALRLISN